MQPDAQRRAAGCELVSEVARQSGEVSLRLSGTSMLPAMWPGDLVTVRHCAPSDLAPGQVVLYTANGSLVAHRLLRIAGDQLTTQGDSIPHSDSPVPTSTLVGRVAAIHRNGRTVDPAPTLRLRILSALVRRSSLCFRIVLRLGTRTTASTTPPAFRPSEPL